MSQKVGGVDRDALSLTLSTTRGMLFDSVHMGMCGNKSLVHSHPSSFYSARFLVRKEW